MVVVKHPAFIVKNIVNTLTKSNFCLYAFMKNNHIAGIIIFANIAFPCHILNNKNEKILSMISFLPIQWISLHFP